jgi:hypothetical protein
MKHEHGLSTSLYFLVTYALQSITQEISGYPECHRHVERCFNSLHGQAKNTFALRQNARVNTRDLASHYKCDGRATKVTYSFKQRFRAGATFERP